MDICKTKPDIDYPCRWTYKVIGLDEQTLRRGIARVIGLRAHDLCLSHRSASGKYTSLTLELTVHSEPDRVAILAGLNAHAAVKIVL